VRQFSLLFDLDGTLVDSDALHLRAFKEILRGSGVDIDEAYYRSRIAGRPNNRILAEAFPSAPPEQRVTLAAKKEELYRDSLATLRIVPGARKLLRWAKSEGIRCAVVTTCPRASAEAVLNATALIDHFDLLIVGDEVERGKPDPLPYAMALLKLGIGPGDAVAFEDSPSGLASAVGAGISTVGMLTSLDENAALHCGAIKTVRDFDDVELRCWLKERCK
jgi:HAD superfamily hydrolase (TIGR01509 family)